MYWPNLKQQRQTQSQTDRDGRSKLSLSQHRSGKAILNPNQMDKRSRLDMGRGAGNEREIGEIEMNPTDK